MSLVNSIAALPYGLKLIVGISFGLFCYGVLRYLVYLGNKGAKELGIDKVKKNLSQEEKLERLMTMGKD